MLDNSSNVGISVSDDESDDHGRMWARARRKRKKLLHRGENGFALRLLRKLLRYWMLLIIIPVVGFLVFEAFTIGTKPSLIASSQLGTPNDPSQSNSEFGKVDQSTPTLGKDPKSNLNRLDPTTRVIGGVRQRYCPSDCSGNGKCLSNGICACENGYTGIDCSAADCDEQCSLDGGVCDNGVCEFRCSDYAKYTCQNSSTLLWSLSVCKNVLENDLSGQHCAPSEPSLLQQVEEVVVMPNYQRLFPGGAWKLFNIFGGTYCNEAAKRLACWISIQKCDKDGENRLRVCGSACQSYNLACGTSLDCSDQTLFSSEGEREGRGTGAGQMKNGGRSNIF